MLAGLKGLQTTRKQTHCRASYFKPDINRHWQIPWRNTNQNNLPLLRETSRNFYDEFSYPNKPSHTPLKHRKSLGGCLGRRREMSSCQLVSKETQDTMTFRRGLHQSQIAVKQLPPPQKGCKGTHKWAKARVGPKCPPLYKKSTAWGNFCLSAPSCWASRVKRALNDANRCSFV